MEKHDARGRGLPLHVVEDELVAVGRLEDLAPEGDQAAAAGSPPPDRLEVRAGQPPGGDEVASGFKFLIFLLD